MIGHAVSDHPRFGGKPGVGLGQFMFSVAGLAIAICALAPYWIAQAVLLPSGQEMAAEAMTDDPLANGLRAGKQGN